MGGARTAVTKRLRITDYSGNHLGTDAPSEAAWGGYARLGVVVDVQRLTRKLGMYLGVDGAAISVGEGATTFWRVKAGVSFRLGD